MSTARALLACIAISCPALLSAQSIVQTFTFGPADFTGGPGVFSFSPSFTGTVNQFDPALGTLTSINVQYSFTFSGSVTIGGSAGGGGFSVGGDVTWNGEGIDGAGGAGGGGGGGPGTSVPLSATTTLNETPPGLNYATATGTSTAIFGFTASVSASGFPTGTTAGTFQLDGGTLRLTYGYTPIPEPGTYALLAGLAGLGAVAWQRRARFLEKSRSAS